MRIQTFILMAVIPLTGCTSRYGSELSEAVDAMEAIEIENLASKLASNTNEWWLGDSTNAIQRGIVRLKDGERVRFAFLSHHQTSDQQSHTVFKTDRYSRHIRGYFCCEVEFQHIPQPETMEQFDKLIGTLNGRSP